MILRRKDFHELNDPSLVPKYFVRQASAVAVAHRMKFHHESLSKASKHVVRDLLKDGGMGGLIAVDGEGNGEQII